ncbi:hypothetical protein BDZ94DRAFT_814942 [Collybia nuda]|uniref:DUF6534 domain-containing protein n=1 Tax=Collybia nuda TaxID=64659 RepID=A0A9P5Y4W3_9AGAR|nr:hypothetical protein BDZ94DRAFT_814942 [Collybia nuda]
MPSLQQPTLDNTVGAAYLGVVGSAFLFGVTTLQAYWYYHRFTKDSRLHKYSVGILWLLDTFHLALTIHAVYVYVVTGFGNRDGLEHIVWSIKLQVSINVVVVLMVQTLYAFRVWILGGYHRGFLGYLVAAVVAGGFAIGIILAYKVYTVDTFRQLEGVGWAINASLAASTTIDFVIAGTMCYYLRKSKGTETRISRLMQYTLSSGLFTSACSLSAMFSYILIPNTLIFLAVEFLLTKLYIGSFFAMLNARERTREPRDSERSSGRYQPSQHHFKLQSTSFRSPSLPSASSSSVCNS